MRAYVRVVMNLRVPEFLFSSVFKKSKPLFMQCGSSGMYFWHLCDFGKFWGFLGPKMVICRKILKSNTIYRVIKYETTREKNEELPSKEAAATAEAAIGVITYIIN